MYGLGACLWNIEYLCTATYDGPGENAACSFVLRVSVGLSARLPPLGRRYLAGAAE